MKWKLIPFGQMSSCITMSEFWNCLVGKLGMTDRGIRNLRCTFLFGQFKTNKELFSFLLTGTCNRFLLLIWTSIGIHERTYFRTTKEKSPFRTSRSNKQPTTGLWKRSIRNGNHRNQTIKTSKNNQTKREDERNINKQNKKKKKKKEERNENRNKNGKLITFCAWTAGVFSATKCNHFPIFIPVFYLLFFFCFFLMNCVPGSFLLKLRISAGFMESVFINREYLSKVVLWKKLELRVKHNQKRNLLHTYSLYKFC